MTTHELLAEAREALGWEASDDDVTLAAIVLTLMRCGRDQAQIGQIVGLVDHLAGGLSGNLEGHLQAAVTLANDELERQARGA